MIPPVFLAEHMLAQRRPNRSHPTLIAYGDCPKKDEAKSENEIEIKEAVSRIIYGN